MCSSYVSMHIQEWKKIQMELMAHIAGTQHRMHKRKGNVEEKLSKTTEEVGRERNSNGEGENQRRETLRLCLR